MEIYADTQMHIIANDDDDWDLCFSVLDNLLIHYFNK